jgi:GTP:adenosylcobinamide-phosphate guanylyltransferase
MFRKFKKAANTVKCIIRSAVQKVREKLQEVYVRAACATSGEMYVDTAAKVLIACVIGMLILVAFYALFKSNIIPSVTSKINYMLNYPA